jgi:biopolymer transport protein ExbD
MKRRPQGDVELPITPMLDMAFQLLTFFILTYRPAPTEGQIAMTLMPEIAASRVQSGTSSSSSLPEELNTIPVVLLSDGQGQLAGGTVGEVDVADMAGIRGALKGLAQDPSLSFDRGLIRVDPRLNYSEVIRVMDEFMKLGVSQINFADLDSE